MKRFFRILTILLLFPNLSARAQKEQVTPEPVVVAPVNPVAVIVDMRDGFWCQALKAIDLDGEQRSFTLIYFPKRYLTGPEVWTAGVREALVHFYGCETFRDCTPELAITSYKYEPAAPALRSTLDSFFPVYIFPLVSSPTSHKHLGIALIN